MPAKSDIRVHFLPQLAGPDQLRSTCVAIDVLRATTCIVEAIGQGAAGVYPCQEIDEARRVAESLGGVGVLAGEREGRQIPGFDLGNSPADFTPESVRGKWVIMTTTNGTPAIAACRRACRTAIAAFANLSAVVAWITSVGGEVDLVCAGTAGAITLEDVLLAGAITFELATLGNDRFQVANDAARMAAELWIGLRPLSASILATCQGGRNLTAIGAENDLPLSARIDRWTCVPELTPSSDGRLCIR